MRTQFTDQQSSFNGYLFNNITVLIIGNPNNCLINILCMVRMKEKNNGRIGESYEEIAKKKKEGEIPH